MAATAATQPLGSNGYFDGTPGTGDAASNGTVAASGNPGNTRNTCDPGEAGELRTPR